MVRVKTKLLYGKGFFTDPSDQHGLLYRNSESFFYSRLKCSVITLSWVSVLCSDKF